ncbi:hypothetical protein GH733_004188 [Mirounga leonina]|nr:hypothetical protein GH733_004188 [Mirounga leonina]
MGCIEPFGGSPGGAHEGLQHLGPFGNIPNIVAELTGDNIPKDFSEDQGYPDPPNPCPAGKTVDDGCLENTPDTAEFSREFQLHQHLFDPEHDYPGLGKWAVHWYPLPHNLLKEMKDNDAAFTLLVAQWSSAAAEGLPHPCFRLQAPCPPTHSGGGP